MKRLLLAIGVLLALVVLIVLTDPILHIWLNGPFERGFYAYKEGRYSTALEYWLPLAQAGDGRAQRRVGGMYEDGLGAPEDVKKAAEWYRKAADQGDAEGQAFLGIMYAKGQGVAQDDKQAVQWFRKAATQGSARAHSLLGDMYSGGRGIQKDAQKASDSCRKAVELDSTAAQQGDAGAQTALGFAYFNGNGVPRDYKREFEFFSKAAEQGKSICPITISASCLARDSVWRRTASRRLNGIANLVNRRATSLPPS